MKTFTHWSSPSFRLLVAGAALVFPATGVMADKIYSVAAKGGKPFARDGVTILKIERVDDAEVLTYRTPNGDTATKKLEDVVQIEAEGEAVFNQAEAEFFKNDLQAASDDYRKVISSSTKEWIKHRADVRLLFITSKTGDFLGAVTGFVELAKKDPSTAGSHRPAIPEKSAQLGSAIATVNAGMANATVESKRVVYPFLIELYNKNNEPDKAKSILTTLQTISPKGVEIPGQPDANANADALAAKQAAADIALTSANKALAAHDYTSALSTINAASASFVAPDQQSRALYIVAQSKAATATTAEALEDAALAYMRVVAFFKSQADPAADALYQVGVIEERLKKVNEAKLIYGQVVSEYGGSKAGQDAQAALTRLNK